VKERHQTNSSVSSVFCEKKNQRICNDSRMCFQLKRFSRKQKKQQNAKVYSL